MINLTSGQANTVKLTLREKASSSLGGNYVLFIFQHGNEATQAVIATSVTQYGSEPDRATDEVVIPSTTFNTVNALYNYTCYEQTNNTNTDPDDAVVVGEIERGRAYISGTNEVTYTANGNSETFVVNQ